MRRVVGWWAFCIATNVGRVAVEVCVSISFVVTGQQKRSSVMLGFADTG